MPIGRSTDAALHHLVSRVEVQLEAKGYALGAFLDIEGAFYNTSYAVIWEALANRNAPEALVDSKHANKQKRDCQP